MFLEYRMVPVFNSIRMAEAEPTTGPVGQFSNILVSTVFALLLSSRSWAVGAAIAWEEIRHKSRNKSSVRYIFLWSMDFLSFSEER